MARNIKLTIDERAWAKQQTNAALQDEGAVAIARNLLTQRKIPLQADRWKNWDQYLAIYHAKRLVAPQEAVLDAGACRDPLYPSTFLPGLRQLGYKDLHGCNLDEGAVVTVGGITYRHGDVTGSPYPDKSFDYVACLSTIEHGVDWRKFYAEMARIIPPGGYLFVSFDYWETPVDTKGQTAFGVPIKIFTKDDVMQMAIFAHQMNLRISTIPEFGCGDPLVKWMGMEYTFFNMLLRKH